MIQLSPKNNRRGLMRILEILLTSIVIGNIICTQSVWAQNQVSQPTRRNVLSMKQAITIAVGKHPLIESATHTLRAGEARTEQARAPLYPQVGASAIETAGALRSNAFLRPSGSLIQPNQTDFTLGLTVSQLLYDFGQTSARIAASRFAAQALQDDLQTQKATIILNVQRAYYEALKRLRLVQIADETVRERQIIRQQVEALYRQNLKAKLDMDLVQVELSKAEVDLIRAKNDLTAGYAVLNNAMGVSEPQAYTLENPPGGNSVIQPLDRLLATGMEKRPELLALREQVHAAEQRINAADSENFPTLSAVGSAGDTEHLAGRPNLREGGWWGAGVVLSVPLFTGFLIENQVREATEQEQEAQAAQHYAEQAIQLEINNAFLAEQTLTQQIKAIEALVKQTQEALQLARQRYQLGLSSIVEVTQGEVAVTTAETRLAETQYDDKAAEATLAYAVGEGIQSF